MDINPTLSVRPASTSAMPGTGKRRKLTQNLHRVQQAPAQPASNTPVRHKTALRILNQEIENVCLHALMTDFNTWWDNVPRVGSKQSQLEHLLFQFGRHEIGDLMAYQLREVLLLNDITVNVTAASDALATVKAEVSADDQLWFDAYSKKNPIRRQAPVTGWVRTLLKAEGCPRLKQPALRRALLKIGVDVISTTLNVLLRALKVEITDEQRTRVKLLWQSLASEDCLISRLVMLMNMAEYQQLSLQDNQLQKAIAVNDHIMKSALLVFNATINSDQQRWFDTWFAANRRKLTNHTTSGALVILLSQEGRPPLEQGQLWRLLWLAGVTLGFASLSMALSSANESMMVNLTNEQKRHSRETWDRYIQQGGMSPEKMMGLTMIECKINAAQLSFVLSHAGIEVCPTSMHRAGLAAKTHLPARAVLSWAADNWKQLTDQRIVTPFAEKDKKFRVLKMLGQADCPQVLKEITTPALMHLMWEIGADVSFTTLSIVLDIISRQPVASTSSTPASDTAAQQNAERLSAIPDEFGYQDAHEWDDLLNIELMK
ncbi:hypothetical protein SC171_27955 [Pantoea cypripedii]|uniref:hypothetical protein n=1 Tax=Pantoea cypripedii TaxID=55209 RepID=UPI002FC589A6